MPDAMLPYGKLPHEIKMDEVIKVGEAKSLRVSSSPADSRLILATLGSDAYKICHPVLIPNLYMILEIYPLCPRAHGSAYDVLSILAREPHGFIL